MFLVSDPSAFRTQSFLLGHLRSDSISVVFSRCPCGLVLSTQKSLSSLFNVMVYYSVYFLFRFSAIWDCYLHRSFILNTHLCIRAFAIDDDVFARWHFRYRRRSAAFCYRVPQHLRVTRTLEVITCGKHGSFHSRWGYTPQVTATQTDIAFRPFILAISCAVTLEFDCTKSIGKSSSGGGAPMKLIGLLRQFSPKRKSETFA